MYNYLAQSNLIASVVGNVHTATYDYEPGRNAMSSLTNTVSSTSTVVSGHASRYDALGRRTDVVRTGTAMSQDFLSRYGYDSLGQLTADERYEGTNPDSPGTALSDETFGFQYDSIGNRQSATAGPETTTYTADLLNQYDLIGSHEPIYDADGNLVSDSQYSYIWNGENRLILVEPIVATEGSNRVEFTYDYLGRRVKKSVWMYALGSWTEASVTAFVYDGWNLVEEISSDSVSRVYTWGLDLSGSLQGAGGVGGLLAQTRTESTETQTYYYTYDFNGNVSELLDASGVIAAHYEYGAFGELLRKSGDIADANTFRFGTKYTDTETGLLYYGYRYYDPVKGRWVNRDPLQEEGGVNLYGFIRNDGVNRNDYLGNQVITKSSIQGYRDAITNALESITGADLDWCEVTPKSGAKYWKIVVNSGGGSLWGDISWAIKNPFRTYQFLRYYDLSNAKSQFSGWNRKIWINEGISVDLPVEDGVDSAGDPKYRKEFIAFEIALWHEFVGHAIKSKTHPKKPWNYYGNRLIPPLPSQWGKVDPVVKIENEARTKLGYPKRRPQYYN